MTLLFSLSCGAFAPRLLGDAGIGWHIRNGQQMWLTHAVTRVDVFSSTMAGKPWFAWEWLYDLFIAAIHGWSGLNGVVFVTAVIVAATFAITFRWTLARGGNPLVTMILLALSMGVSAIHLFARPHVLSWLLAVIWFRVLDASPGRPQALWFLPGLMVLWVNLHGGFLTGFFLLGIYLAGAIVEYLAAEGIGTRLIARRLKWLGGISAVSFLATFANPYGYNLHVHIYRYLSDRFLMNHIQEFASPNFHGAAERCFAVLVLIAVVALAAARKKLSSAQLLVVIFAVASGLYAARNLPVSSLLLTMIVGPLLSRSVADAAANLDIADLVRRPLRRWNSLSLRLHGMETSLSGHLWSIAALIVGIWACSHGGRLGSSQIFDAHFSENRFPVQAVDVIAQRGLREPVFCPDYWGGYLIYRLYPDVRVVVDDRHDLYGSEFFKQYLKTIHGEPGWQELLDKEHVRLALVPEDSTIANLLKLVPEWRETYQDKAAVLFERK